VTLIPSPDRPQQADRPQPLGPGTAVAAFDVGGTDMKAALFDSSGQMLGLRRTPTPHRGAETAEAVLERVEELLAEFAHTFPHVRPAGIGLIAPGVVDDDQGIVRESVNLDWNDVPFRRLLEDRLHLPASFSHDVRAAGEAEFQLGAARGFGTVVVIIVGTGIAASLVVNGRAHVAGGYAGELGHSIVDPRGALCACGARGCLETVGSAGAISRRYAEATGQEPVGAREVLALAAAGDPAARRIWNEAIDALALGIAQLTAILAPEAVVIGGGLAEAGDALFVPLRERVDALLSFHRRPLVLPALIGENAGLIGAALRARAAADRSGQAS